MNAGSVLAQFTVKLTKPATEPVAVLWKTNDGTAKAGVDYAAAGGTVNFAVGEDTKTIEVLVYGRAVGSEDRTFSVLMLPPGNAILGQSVAECIISVDTTGSTPVIDIILPDGPQGLQGKSAYQSWLDSGHTGTEDDFVNWLRPTPEEIAEEIAPQINVGDSLLVTKDTTTLPHPDAMDVKALAKRVAYADGALLATVVLGDGDNTIQTTDFTGDAIDFRSPFISFRIFHAGAMVDADWSVGTDGKLTVKAATAGDVLYGVEYRLVQKNSYALTANNNNLAAAIRAILRANINAAMSGINSDITSLTALSGGPLTLGGDAVGDYDAVTLRQARNMGGGTGPTQSGVMNYGVGSRRLHDSRAWIPSYEVYGDGQLLSRTAYPDLWAFAQLVGLIDDSVWKSTPAQRGHYSRGDGSTTFRVPDLNGVKKNGDESGAIVGDSIPGLYGRGDGGVSSNNGTIQKSGVPNINTYMDFRAATGGASAVSGNSDVFDLTTRHPDTPTSGQLDVLTSTSKWDRLTMNFGKNNDVYQNGLTEARPNSFIGVWVIRANGGFTAANTAWHVINGDTVAPGTGTLVRGGDVFSDYKVANANYVQAIFRSRVTIGGAASAEVVIRDSRSGSPVDKIIDIGALDARVGATILSVTNPALGSRTVVENPFGNSTPVFCMVEFFHATLQKWSTAPWQWTGASGVYGMTVAYSEGEGIVLRIAANAYCDRATTMGPSQELTAIYTTPSPVRIHVWLAKS